MENDKKLLVKMCRGKYNSFRAIRNVIQYITQNKENGDRCKYVGGTGVYYCDWKKAAIQMQRIQIYFNKNSGRRLYHMVVSFENKNVDLYAVIDLADKITDDILKGFQCIYAMHGDTDNYHLHIVWNPVNYKTGMKWHTNKKEWAEVKRKIYDLAVKCKAI